MTHLADNHHDHACPPHLALEVCVSLAGFVPSLGRRRYQPLLLDDETGVSFAAPRTTYDAPMKRPDPTARHTPTILNEGFEPTLSPWPELEAAAALSVVEAVGSARAASHAAALAASMVEER
jgi:hypothetical protein